MARKILLADDSVTAQNMGRKILADAGYEVITVNNGSAALKKINEARPDLIVLDVYMPGYSGLEVCQRLKETQETARIPILLTVGKLEPFKADEAKRVRADAFIVKPFEASELLSALTKLEDKIVPRAESSKPGRFARSIAAIEEGRYDRAASSEEDSGWKNRIAFPAGKKESASEPEDATDPAIYNPVNKDLRTVVDHSAPDFVPVPKSDGQVDVSALSPAGLPTDVTPEEIAALAAAAAQVKKNLSERQEEHSSTPTGSENPAIPAHEQGSQVPPSAAATPLSEEASPTPMSSEAEGLSPIASAEPEEAPAAVTKTDETPTWSSAAETGSSNAKETQTSYGADEPATMAAAAGGSASRWTAVAVALSPEEASLSLEMEMQQACAVLAPPADASPGASPSLSSAFAESGDVSAQSRSGSSENSVSELAQTFAQIADAAHSVMAVATGEFEAAAASYVSEASVSAPSADAISEPGAAELPVTAEAVSQDEPAKSLESGIEATGHDSGQDEAPVADLASLHDPQGFPAPTSEAAIQEQATENDVQQHPIDQHSEGPQAEGQSGSGSGELGHTGQKESEIAATTAAAWASWRRIRESGQPQGTPDIAEGNGGQSPSSPDSGAMAVAAGAESSPEDVSSEPESEEIASIVDSVLADLRPKIVEEISRKLGKKK